MAIPTMPVALSLERNNYLLSWHHWRYFTRGMHMSEAPLSGIHNIWEPYLNSMQGLALHVASFLHANNSWLDSVANSNITLLHPVCSSWYVILTAACSSSWTNSWLDLKCLADTPSSGSLNLCRLVYESLPTVLQLSALFLPPSLPFFQTSF